MPRKKKKPVVVAAEDVSSEAVSSESVPADLNVAPAKDRNAWRRARGCTCGQPEGEPHELDCPRLKMLLERELDCPSLKSLLDGQPAAEEALAVEEAGTPSDHPRLSGQDLAAILRQQRREARMKDKGY